MPVNMSAISKYHTSPFVPFRTLDIDIPVMGDPTHF